MFYDTLQKGLIHNCTTTVQDAKNAFHIYGPDEGALMGKSTREMSIVMYNRYVSRLWELLLRRGKASSLVTSAGLTLVRPCVVLDRINTPSQTMYEREKYVLH